MTLGQGGKDSESDDGMELGICYLPPALDEMTFVGARTELYVAENGSISEIKGTRTGIGYRDIPWTQGYKEYRIKKPAQKNFYISSDGLTDQVGGNKGLMFGKRRFKSLLIDLQGRPMAEQKDRIWQALLDYQGNQARRDDVSVIGFQVG
jgi:hypothetical protein